jgi:hypothetical protein
LVRHGPLIQPSSLLPVAHPVSPFPPAPPAPPRPRPLPPLQLRPPRHAAPFPCPECGALPTIGQNHLRDPRA